MIESIPRQYLLIGGFLILFGVAALLFAFLEFLTRIFTNSIFHKDGQSFGIRMRNSLVYILFLLFFPLFLIWMIIVSKPFSQKSKLTSILFKLIELCLAVGVLIPIWIGTYYAIGVGTTQLVRYKLGYYQDPIRIAGTGSMYPTFPKGTGKTIEEQTKEIVDIAKMNPYPNGIVIRGKAYGAYEIGRGDIVSFENTKTDEITTESTGEAAGFVKRVVGLPGDTIELRDGIVYLNKSPLSEAYTAKAHSTFGGDTVADCQPTKIPENKLFVMGDNRKGSLDSRFELGLISYGDIDHVIPLENQKGTLDKNWRDTTHDLDNSSKIHLDRNEYLKLLNEKRKENNLPPLTYQPKLQTSAEKRAKTMFDANSIVPDENSKKLSMQNAFAGQGYVHYLRGELPAQGYYEAEELFENQSEFIKSKDFLLKKEYQEIGIAEVEGTINGCPTQIIVQHLAGYIPPNYSEDEKKSWQDALTNLKNVQPGWQELKTYPKFYEENKTDVDRINEIITIRITRTQIIVTRINANQWLTDEENRFIDEDKTLNDEQNAIAKRLNEKSH
jgi:signal peptidase I